MESAAQRTVAVLGAGPVGLAAAAHLLEQGFEPIVFETSPAVGASFRDFAHVRLFSPWRYNVDSASERRLAASGWARPEDDVLPTAGDLVTHYLEPLAKTMRDHIRLNARVISVARSGYDKVKSEGREKAPFVIRVEIDGRIYQFLTTAVIDATGNWANPNPLGANGLTALGETELRHRIEYGMPDVLGKQQARYRGKSVLVVGAGHSAVGSLVALAELATIDPDTRIHWVLRSDNPSRAFGGGEADQLPARGELGTRVKTLIEQGLLRVHTGFRVHEVYEKRGGITVVSETGNDNPSVIHDIDEIICATGSRPNLEMVRELRVLTDPLLESSEQLAPLIDPNLHSCGTVRPHGHRELAHPEQDFYIVGAKSYGRAPTFLMATGYEQVRSVVSAMAGDLSAADDVQLELPETGVCITGNAGGGNCCTVPEPVAKKSANEGCGCSTAQATACCS